MSWLKVAEVDEIPAGDSLQVELDGKPVALISTDDGVYAVGDICSHEHAHLSEGWVEGHCIECPLHGAQFDVRTGEPVTLPATQPIPTFEVKVDGNDIYLRSSND